MQQNLATTESCSSSSSSCDLGQPVDCRACHHDTMTSQSATRDPERAAKYWPPLLGPVNRAPNLCPVAARDVGHAAVAFEEFVGHLEDREHQSALRAPGRVAAASWAPDEIALGYREAGVRTFAVNQLAFDHIGLLDLDVLVVGQHCARLEAHQRSHETAGAIEQQRFHLTAGKPRLLPFHFADTDMVGQKIGRADGLWGHGIHGILHYATLLMIARRVGKAKRAHPCRTGWARREERAFAHPTRFSARQRYPASARIGGWKARPVSPGKCIQVSCDTSVMKVSTNGRPLGLAATGGKCAP